MLISRLAVELEVGRLRGCSAFSSRRSTEESRRGAIALLHHDNRRLRLEQDRRRRLLFAACLIRVDESSRVERQVQPPDSEPAAVTVAVSFAWPVCISAWRTRRRSREARVKSWQPAVTDGTGGRGDVLTASLSVCELQICEILTWRRS
jgi:hypothetical protein